MRARYESTSSFDVTRPARIASCSSTIDFSKTSKAGACAGACAAMPAPASTSPAKAGRHDRAGRHECGIIAGILPRGTARRARVAARTIRRHMRKTALTLGAAVAAGAALSVTLLAQGQGITSKDILDGFANPARWLTNAGDYTGQRHSPLKQITPSNASQLAPQWTFQTGAVSGQFAAAPI